MPQSAGVTHLAVVAPISGAIGGLEKFTTFVTTAALDAGWAVTVALCGQDTFEHPARSTGRLKVVPVDWLDATLAGDRQYRWDLIRCRYRWFRRVAPDVALFVQSSNTPLRCSMVGAWLARVPVVSTHRTMPYRIPEVPSRRHFGLIPGIGLHRRKLIAKTWLAAALARRIVYNSEAVRACYERDYLYPRSKGAVIRNAVESADFAGEERPREAIHIGYVGRLSREKRLDLIFEAFASLRSRKAVRLVLVGQGPEETPLRELAARLGIADRIDWRGATRNPAGVYGDLDIVVLASPRESSSNMVLEAMAAGKAVVVTDVGGLPELVEGGRCGLIVRPESTGELAAAMARLADDDALRRTLGQSAAAAARCWHHPRDIAAAWLELLGSTARLPRQVQAAWNQPSGRPVLYQESLS